MYYAAKSGPHAVSAAAASLALAEEWPNSNKINTGNFGCLYLAFGLK
jgi:hypothetical protein